MSNEIVKRIDSRVAKEKMRVDCWRDDRLLELLRDCKAALSQQEPFAWCFTDVNGKAKELVEPPYDLPVQDRRVYTPLFLHPQPQKVDSCDCGDKSQCLEPCGELGHSEDHVVDANKMVPQSVEVWIDDLEDAAVGYVTGAPEAAKELARTASKNLRTFMAGKVLVPVEPTREMIARTVDAVFDGAIEDENIISEIYSAMLTAGKEGV